jgi:hypothetical protein
MKRWEPPVPELAGAADQPGWRGGRLLTGRLSVWTLSGLGRIAIAAAFAVPLMTPQLRSWASAIVIALVLFLVAGIGLAWRLGMPAWGVVWLNDILVLLLLTPPLVLVGYVAAGEAPLQAAGWLAYLEIYVPAIAALAGMTALAKWLGRTRLPGGAPLLLLPGVLQVLALTMVLGSYRDVTVAAVLTSAYLIAALGTFLSPVLRPGWRAWLPLVAVAMYLIILSTAGSGLAALGKIQAPLVLTQMLLMLVALAAVVAVPARDRASLAGRGIGAALIGPRESAAPPRSRAKRRRLARHRAPDSANVTPQEPETRHPVGSAISQHDIGSFPFE